MLKKVYLPGVPLSCLREWDKNYRSIRPQDLQRLKNKIAQIGVFKPLLAIAGAEADTYQIIGGNQRLRAYREMGLTTADILFFPDLTDKKTIAKIALADNQSDGFTEPEKLLALCEDAELDLSDLQDFKLSDDDLTLEDIFAVEEASSEYDEKTPALDKEHTFTRPGDFYLLGRHRLLCGDSTQAETLAQLTGNEPAALLLTDPPYNVDYEGTNGKKIINDKLSPEAFAAFLNKALQAAAAQLRPGGGFYIWYADKESAAFRAACEQNGLMVRQGLVWVKNHFVLSRQDYQWQHEPCLYGWKEGKTHYFTKDRSQSTVLEFDKPIKSEEHPTMKPVGLFARLIANSTQDGETVLDPFGGSGTTLIACELQGRNACLAELDPHYCDVIVKRYMQLDNAGPVKRVRGGKEEVLDLRKLEGDNNA